MVVKQLSVFLENTPGRLRAVTSVLAENNINIRALTLADTSDFGVLRLIVDKPEMAVIILKEKNFTVKLADVIAVEMDDTPGGLDNVLEVLDAREVNIEYMYAFMGAKPKKALVIFRVDKLEEAVESLKAKGIRLIVTEEEAADLIYYCWD
ncbi:ACT domain-containing protein [Desulfitibacter alkalitolerans]|uniref:ACT domain-containing protein n=1 Tax=Desulfitibacter alkalitolerans TaxID=264641 RepID=UPI000486BD59|nr:ACT domain-containing protein [Desulfitibacter alkalitolerans]